MAGQPAEVFKMIGAAVPDLRWSIKDILVSGDQIVVRGEATGTPEGELFGAKPTGQEYHEHKNDRSGRHWPHYLAF